MKKFKELKDKQKLLAVFGILGLVLLLTAGTYAFFTYSKSGSTENTIKSGTITFWYDEINQSGNSISIEDALPMTDEQGKQQTQAFNFKIQSTTSSTNTIPYEITLRQKEGTDNIGNVVKVYLAKTSSVDASIASEEEVELSLFNSLSNVTKNGYSEKLLHTDIVPASDSPYTQFYRLKMWIDNNADFSDGSLNDKTFTVTVNVYANGHVLDANSSVATVNSVSVGGNELAATTVNNIDTYEATLPEGTTSTNITVDTGDYTNITVTKTESDYTTPISDNGSIQRLSQTTSKTVALTTGSNYFKIVATSEDKTDSKEIHIKLNVLKSGPLGQLILEDNPTVYTNPTLTTSSNNTSDANGLYSMAVTNGYGGSDGTTYYFRGNVENNNVRFAEKDWKIVRINEDGTIRLILKNSVEQKKFNSATENPDNLYYSNSSIKFEVETWYDNNIGNNNTYASKIASGNYFCEALRASNSSPNYTCADDANGKGLLGDGYKIGFLTVDEFVGAGGYYNQVNNEFYIHNGTNWWTMTPSGMAKTDPRYNATYPHVWITNNHVNQLQACLVSNTPYFRPVINLKANVTATGTGTSSDPYVVD